ncbi:hypothetical protein D3C76_1262590 [compost metagenome]
MKSGSLPEAINVFSFSFSLPAGTIKLMSTPVFLVIYWEVGSTPHLFGNQAKFRYQSNVIGDVSDFQPGSSADSAVASGAVVAVASAVLPSVLFAVLPLFAALPLLPEQPATDRTMIVAISSSIIFFGFLFMSMLVYPFSEID